jgi:hypothetical protein
MAEPRWFRAAARDHDVSGETSGLFRTFADPAGGRPAPFRGARSELLTKRDDLTGLSVGGNKARLLGNAAQCGNSPRPRKSTRRGRALRLTLLAPEMVEAVLDGRKPDGMTRPRLMAGVTVDSKCQRELGDR